MAYALRKGLHYCDAGGQLVFMDLKNDAYFLLKGTPEKAFRTYLAEDRVSGDALDCLLEHGLLTQSNAAPAAAGPLSVPVPMRSVSELAPARRKTRVTTVLEVAWLIYNTRRKLRTRKISDVLKEHLAFRPTAACRGEFGSEAYDLTDLAHATDQYRAARRLVPIEPSCLLDSLALHRFLAKRDLESRLVFGVNAEPFSAHAWLQIGDLTLNETVSYARMHTPILVL